MCLKAESKADLPHEWPFQRHGTIDTFCLVGAEHRFWARGNRGFIALTTRDKMLRPDLHATIHATTTLRGDLAEPHFADSGRSRPSRVRSVTIR